MRATTTPVRTAPTPASARILFEGRPSLTLTQRLPSSSPGYTLLSVRVLVVTNFMPDAGAPQRGRWVRDQVDEVRQRGVDTDLFAFPPGRGEYVPATRRLRAVLRRERFDLVHAHYGLAGGGGRVGGGP